MERGKTKKLWKRILSFTLAVALVLSGMTIVPNDQSEVQAATVADVVRMDYYSAGDGPTFTASGVTAASYGFVMPKFYDASGNEIAYSDVASDLSVKVNVNGTYIDIDSVESFVYNSNWGHWNDGGFIGYWFKVDETTELQLYLKSNPNVTLNYTLNFNQLSAVTVDSIAVDTPQYDLDATGGGTFHWTYLTVNGQKVGNIDGPLTYEQIDGDIELLVDNHDGKGFVALEANAASGFIWDSNFGIFTDGNGGIWFKNINWTFTLRVKKVDSDSVYADVTYVYTEVDRTNSDCTLTPYTGTTTYDANAATDNSGSIGIELPKIGGTDAVQTDLDKFVYQVQVDGEWKALSDTTTGWVYQGNGYSKYSTSQQWGYWVDTIYGLWFQPVLNDTTIRIGYPTDGSIDSEDLNAEIGNNWITYTFIGNPNANVPDPTDFLPIEVDNNGEPSGDVTSVAAPDGWKLIWNDEFNGTEVNLNNWTRQEGYFSNPNEADTWGWGNNELECYKDDEKYSFVNNGKLTLRMEQENTTWTAGDGDSATSTYTSGKLISQNKFSVKYGRVDFRAKVPSGKGIWPALWMMPNDDVYGTWASSGEIDVFEGIGRTPEMALGTIHYGGQWPDNYHTGDKINMVTHEDIGSDMTNWHVYSLVWEEGVIKMYADGICYFMVTPEIWFSAGANGNKNAPFDQRFYLIMNLACGGWFDGGITPDYDTYQPTEMYVDYVRVYQKEVGADEDEKPDSAELEASGATKGNISVGKDDNLYGDYHIGEVVELKNISLEKTVTTIEAGNTEKLNVNFTPANATNKNVTWTSSDESVATVAGGTVTALKAGTTTITATSAEGGFKATCEVTVTGVAPEKFTVTFNSDGGSAVSTQTITKGGKVTKPSDPTKAGYTFAGWYNGDAEYDFNAEVNANITLTAKWTPNSTEGGSGEGGSGEGGSSGGGDTGETNTNRSVIYDADAKTLTFRVTDAADGVSEVKCAFQTYATQEEAQARAEDKTDAGMPAYPLTKNADGTWECVVENYTANGSYVLYAFYFAGGSEAGLGEWTVSSLDEITATPENTTVAVTGVSLNKTSLDLKEGGTATLTETVAPADATNKAVTWTSSNESVATVVNGVVTAKAAGKATITVKTTDGNKTATCNVTVTEQEAETVEATGVTLNETTLALTEGNTATLTATVAPSNATDKTVTWSTSKSSVATVVNGVVTAKGVGIATITAMTANGRTATCTVTVTAKEVPVTGVTLNTANLALKVDATSTLTETIAPSNATNKAVTWTSSNESVATVENGVVTAKAVGNATITVKTADGNKTATCNVTVTEPDPDEVEVESVELDKDTLELTEGDTATLTETVAPADATNKAVTWTSSDESVATVENGVVTAVKAGKATITVTTANGKTAKCDVTVKAKVVEVTDVELDKETLSLEEEEKATLKATVTPSDATDATVTWETSDDSIATVVNGEVTAVKAGTAFITAKAGNETASCTVTVTAKTIEEETVAVTGVSLNKSSMSLTVGEKDNLTATVTPTDATNKNVSWKSSNDVIATVDANGKVTAGKAGTATITVTTEDGNKTATCTVTVTEKEDEGNKEDTTKVTDVTLNKTALSLTEGENETLTATVSPSTAINKAVSWKSSNDAIATVDANGKVTAVKAGTATITATTADGQKTATCTVTVTEKAPTTTTPPTTTPPTAPTPAPEGSKPEAEAEKTVTETNTDKRDVEGSSFIKLRVKATGKNKQVKLSWKKVKEADGYIIYGAQCGKSLKKLTTLTKTSYTHKKLKKGKYYKYVVAAYKIVDGETYIIETSTSVHAATTGTKYGNPTKVTVKPTKATIKKGKTKKLKATYKASAKKVSTHISKFRYESSNPEVATVDKKGKVKGVKKGKATIYVYAQNGVYKTVKITVK